MYQKHIIIQTNCSILTTDREPAVCVGVLGSIHTTGKYHVCVMSMNAFQCPDTVFSILYYVYL